MTRELRPYQLDLVARVRAARAAGSRVIVVQAATGAGKTDVSSFIAKGAVEKGSRVLFLVHRRKLVDQIADRLNLFGVECGVIMAGEGLYSSAKVQVASRDTLMNRHVAGRWVGMPEANVVMIDEAHHGIDPGSDYRRIADWYGGATILLFTATPVGPEGQGFSPWAKAIECAAPTTELIRQGFLVPVKCFAPDRKMHRGKAKKGIAGDLVESWKTYGDNRPTVLFCSRVAHSQDAVAAFGEAGIAAVHLDAKTPDHKREAAFEGLGNGRVQIVSNVGIIGEGVDIPELGCCQIYCEMGGRVRFIQACGRIMRPANGKTHGILIDHAGAVFQHGFPDEDTEWTLEGDTDELFRRKKADKKTEDALYCKFCEMLYNGTASCPQCGKMPSKPPRSIFAPPPQATRDELLTEADRGVEAGVFSRDEKIKH